MKRVIKLLIDDEEGWAAIMEAIRERRRHVPAKVSTEEHRGVTIAAICRNYLDGLRKPASPGATGEKP